MTVTGARGERVASGGLGSWLSRHAPARARGRVTIALVSDGQMRRLNGAFRGKDTVTDVLSFPAGDPSGSFEPPARRRSQTRAPGPDLGEIAIAVGLARRQARKLGHSEAVERRILALHGLLHLLGYDHEADRGEMKRLEERLRTRAGLPVALIARTTRAGR